MPRCAPILGFLLSFVLAFAGAPPRAAAHGGPGGVSVGGGIVARPVSQLPQPVPQRPHLPGPTPS